MNGNIFLEHPHWCRILSIKSMNQCLLMSPDLTSKDKDSFRKCLQGGAATVGDGEPEAPGGAG